jgi:predicted AlkP superfamily phosphohydrolase/phosphomutase
MKLMMIGADAAHREAFARGWTPYIEGRLAKAAHLPVCEDLISRGWSSICLGQSANVTGALYDRPDLKGTTGWSLKFRMNEAPGFGNEVMPLWQVLNEMGYKVGIMNVPTIFPAPEVDGFFVSGGGGGAPIVQDVEDGFCYPESIADQLRGWGYIVDERQTTLLGEKALKTPNEVFERLIVKNERRAEAFIRLSKEYNIDFGFVVFKSSSVIAELLVLSELAAAKRSGGKPDAEIITAAEKYYRHFDQLIEMLATTFPEAETLMVSDHGSIVPDHYLNTNSLLSRLRYQPKSVSNSLLTNLVRTLKKYLPYALREKLKKSKAIKSKWQDIAVSPPSSSTAFSVLMGSWRNGIYINDKVRFGGPIDAEDIACIAKKVTDDINQDVEMRHYGISAKVRSDGIGNGSQYFPDVVLDMPDNIITSPSSTEVVSKVALPKAPLGLRSVTEGKLFCMKSSAALAANLSGKWECSEREPDLTSVYSHICHVFNKIR